VARTGPPVVALPNGETRAAVEFPSPTTRAGRHRSALAEKIAITGPCRQYVPLGSEPKRAIAEKDNIINSIPGGWRNQWSNSKQQPTNPVKRNVRKTEPASESTPNRDRVPQSGSCANWGGGGGGWGGSERQSRGNMKTRTLSEVLWQNLHARQRIG